jgi:hypothetical protein
VVTSDDPKVVKKYDPLNLPLRTHDEFMDQAREVQFAESTTDNESLAKEYGTPTNPNYPL